MTEAALTERIWGLPLRLPRTWRGWKTFFWLGLGCCPIHHCRLAKQEFPHDPNGYCFACEGVGVWPGSLRRALHENYEKFMNDSREAIRVDEPG
jgi:hypothetical protein